MNTLARCGKHCISRANIHHLKPFTQRHVASTLFSRLCHDGRVSSASSEEQTDISTRIVIHNLPKCSSKEVYDLVRPYGNVINYDDIGAIERFKFLTKNLPTLRYSFVVFETESEADKAITSLHGTVFKQRTLDVKLVNSTDYRLPGQPKDVERLKSYKPREIQVDQDARGEIDEFLLGKEEWRTSEKISEIFQYSNIETLVFLINRFNTVSLHCVKKCVKELEEKGIQLSPEDAILILVSTGDLMKDVHPSKRMQFTERVWSVFERGDISLTVPMFNALMRVYIENNHKFDGLQMLATMQSLDLKPDVDTYGLLISSFSEQGDIENASMIVDYMATDGISLNSNVFNYLIKGFFRAKDIDGAMNMMDVMRENEFDPGLPTYNLLMSLFAENGNLQSMKWIMSEMERIQIPIKSYMLFDCIVKLVRNSHEEHVPEIMAMLQYEKKFFKDAIACIKQLIQHGYVQKAYSIYIQFFEPEQSQHISDELFGRFILNTFAANNTPFNEVSPVICDMDDRGHKRAITEMTRQALMSENHEVALQCFELLKKRGHPLRAHMLWPLFLQLKNNNNLEGLLDMLKKNKELLPPDEQISTSPYVQMYILPVCEKLQKDCKDYLSLLESEGLHRGEINFSYYFHLAMNSRFDEAFEFGSKNDMAVNFSMFRGLAQVPNLSANWKQVLQVMNIQQIDWEKSADVAGYILEAILSKTDADPTEVVEYFMSMKFYLLERNWKNIRRPLKDCVHHDVIKEMEMWHIYKHFPTSWIDIRNVTIEHVEYLADRRPDVIFFKELLLRKYCAVGNVEKVEELKSEMERDKPIDIALNLQLLVFFYAFYQRDVNNALKYLDSLETVCPWYDNYYKGLLHTLCLLSEEGNVKELKKHALLFGDRHYQKLMENRENRNQRNLIDDICSNILKNLVEKTILEEVIDIAFTLKRVFNIQKLAVSQVVQSYTDRGETENAIKAFERLITAGIYIKPEIVYIHLMEKGDSLDQIQKVMELLKETKGQSAGKWSLMFSCVWCGKLKEARTIVEDHGSKNLNVGFIDDFEYFCDKLVINQKISELENLVKLTNELDDFDKSIGILWLIKGYVSVNDIEKAKDVLLNCAENLTWRPHIIKAIANQFRNCGIDPAEISPMFENQRDIEDPKYSQRFRKDHSGFRKDHSSRRQSKYTDENM